MSSQAPITLEQARSIAVQAAEFYLKHLASNESIPLLEDRVLEAEGCWMFFRNRDIKIPPEQRLAEAAYIVSKRGNARAVADFSDDPTKLWEYLQFASDYFIQHQQ